MRLAADPITIEIAGEAFELRPTLRAATRLARRYGDFATLYRRIIADHVSVVSDVIREGSGAPHAAADFLTACELPGLGALLATLKLPLMRYVLALAGHDDNGNEPPATTGKPITLAEYHVELFAIGTGWLGWSPEQTWTSTPAEILAAQRGRSDLIVDVLKSVFGSTDKPAPAAPDLDAQFDRAAFYALKARLGASNARRAAAHA
jgi:hypothetical protein